jgi:hypothetical protein
MHLNIIIRCVNRVNKRQRMEQKREAEASLILVGGDPAMLPYLLG